jgi:protein-serine/threonine kinase
LQRKQFRDDGYGGNMLEEEPPERFYTPAQNPGSASQPDRGQQYRMGGSGDWEQYDADQQLQQNALPQQQFPSRRDQSLRPHQRRMGDAYDHGHGGSSSATRRVMDFFRRRGKDRSEM